MMTAQRQVFHGAGQPLSLERRDLDFDLAPGEVLVAIDLATVCGSDLHTIDGTRTEVVPSVLGHEAVGRVVRAGAGRALTAGDRITWSIADTCGTCRPCTGYGLPQKCEQLFKYGHASIANGTGLNGCYASHIVLRPGTHIVAVPPTLADRVVAPANCALATMVNAVSQLLPSGSAVPESVLVQGGGLLGLYGCALLRARGVPHVYCTELDHGRFPFIEKFGGTPLDGREQADPVAQILDRHRLGVDAVFEVAGAKEVVPQGVQVLRNGGFYGLVGLVHSDSALTVNAEVIIRKCLTLRGVHNYGPSHLDEAMEFLLRSADVLPFEDLVSPPVALSRLEDAVDLAKSRRWFRVSVTIEDGLPTSPT